MSPKHKRGDSISKPRNKRTKNTWHVSDAERFTEQPQSYKIVKRDPNQSSRSTGSSTNGSLPDLLVQHMLNLHIPSRATGSHTFDQFTVVDCDMVTLGNTSSASGGNPSTYSPMMTSNLSGHTFTGFTILDSRGVHIGNTGSGSEGHTVTEFHVKGAGLPMLGDFSTADIKHQTYRNVVKRKIRV